MNKPLVQSQVLARLRTLLEDEDDLIAAMATVACELFHAFDHYHWVGFYRVVGHCTLKIGPYQGTHGCPTIPFARGVCGACARTRQTQWINDVSRAPHHIACANSTQSEVVVPVLNAQDELIAVLDVDSNHLNAFDDADREFLESVAHLFARRGAAFAAGTGSAS